MQLSKLIGELASAGEAELGVQLDGGVLERLLAYSRSVASFPTAVKEVSWLHDIKHLCSCQVLLLVQEPAYPADNGVFPP